MLDHERLKSPAFWKRTGWITGGVLLALIMAGEGATIITEGSEPTRAAKNDIRYPDGVTGSRQLNGCDYTPPQDMSPKAVVLTVNHGQLYDELEQTLQGQAGANGLNQAGKAIHIYDDKLCIQAIFDKVPGVEPTYQVSAQG